MGVLFARDFHDQAECFAELGEEMGEEANLEIGQGQCGLASVESVSANSNLAMNY